MSGSEEGRKKLAKSNYYKFKEDYKDYGENDELIVEENTIYEIDLDSYDVLMREKKRYMQ